MSTQFGPSVATVDLPALFGRALDEFERRVTTVSAEQWSAPTPCTDWDVRTLVGHVVAEQLWAPSMLAGETMEEVGDRFDGDVLGDDAAAAWRSAAARARSAAGAPDALEVTVHASYGAVPAGRYLTEMTLDVAVHTWDLARGIGADERLDPDLVDFALAVVEPNLAMLSASGLFAPPLPVAEGASAQERLLALLGRQA